MAVTGHSCSQDIDVAVNEIKQALGRGPIQLVIYFASPIYSPGRLAHAMHAAFPGVTTIGCTTAGEITDGSLQQDSVVAMALGPETLGDVCVAVVQGLRNDIRLHETFRVFEEHFGVKTSKMECPEYVGLTLIDGLSVKEETLMEGLNAFTTVPFIGGSAGDGLRAQATYVCADGKAYNDAALLLLAKPEVPFDFIKTQSCRVLPEQLTATCVDEAHRTVIEFDGKPAILAYAEAIGCSPIEAKEGCLYHPLGLMVGKEPYIRSPHTVTPEGAIVFHSAIRHGSTLALLEITGMVEPTRAAIEKTQRELGGITALIDFDCMNRLLQLQLEHDMDNYARLFDGIPTVGFHTYGEQLLGHVNQTATMLAFA